jgi:hypothetical protein
MKIVRAEPSDGDLPEALTYQCVVCKQVMIVERNDSREQENK